VSVQRVSSGVESPPIDWPFEIYQTLVAAGVRQVSYVPDAGHARLIDLCRADDAMTTISLTSEEQGVAAGCGAWLGGEKAVLLMQSSGVGNCVNMLTLLKTCGVPLVMLVTMRGREGEFNRWQVPMGTTSGDVLALSGVHVEWVREREHAAGVVDKALEIAYGADAPRAVAVLIDQRVIGVKAFAR
jgi:sulfopyruvate decarboxylase alpha subunit